MDHRTTPPHLYLRGRTYYFRIAVPQRPVPIFKRRLYKKSLCTRNYRTTVRLAKTKTKGKYRSRTLTAQNKSLKIERLAKKGIAPHIPQPEHILYHLYKKLIFLRSSRIAF